MEVLVERSKKRKKTTCKVAKEDVEESKTSKDLKVTEVEKENEECSSKDSFLKSHDQDNTHQKSKEKVIENTIFARETSISKEQETTKPDILHSTGSLKISEQHLSHLTMAAAEDKTNSNKIDDLNKDMSKILSLDQYLNTNIKILKTIENIDSLPSKINSLSLDGNRTVQSEFKIQKLDIKPYTEQQLSSLYSNTELERLEDFQTRYIEAELKCLSVKQHYLYELLTNYLKVREKITGNKLELDQLRKEYRDLQGNLWTLETASVTGRAECQDGQIVSASHSYNKSILHRSVFQSITRLLMNIQKLVYENHILFTYSAEDLKLQIELYIQSVIHNVRSVTNLNLTEPVSLSMQSEPNHLQPYFNEVRLCISVLFAFQRKIIRDSVFLTETREWLSQLITVLLKIANFQDHLFLINHILRCPAGVGSWGSSFIQVPLNVDSADQPFANFQVNHLLAVLSVVLSPIKERDKFLKDISQNQNVSGEAVWVLIDSDGEEDDENAGISLKENDLVALFNQLPLDDLFRCLLLIRRKDQQDFYDVRLCNEQHILRYFAFSTVLLRLLHTGLQTYNQGKYNQFSKRLCRLIRHVVQYATDQLEQFIKVGNYTDYAMIERLQCEYDSFFLRAIFTLYSSQKLGAWQFLAVVPYNMVTVKILWKIFYFLHVSDKQSRDILNPMTNSDYRDKLWERDCREQFEEKLEKLEDAEVYYLLNTYANMALARSNDDMEFILAATMDLLQVGFISKSTRDACSKSARILLTHITSKHPHLISSVLRKVKDNLENIDELVLYLYEEIPLSVWILSDKDFEIIAGLLLYNTINDVGTKLARMILSRLSWDLQPYEKHCDTAILVLKAVNQEQGYLQWGWQTILRLKLHISDKHFTELGKIDQLEKFDILLKGISDNHPLAGFVAVLMTSWGHLVPLICSHGLNQILNLQINQKHEAALFALYQIIPIFITSQECIINCAKFQEILTNLINADRGYISYAKSFILTQNTVLQQFGNMIETQIVNYVYYGLSTPRLLTRLWMNSLISIPNWNKDTGILYLLDIIIKAAFFYKDSLEIIYETLRELYQCGTPQESASIINIFRRSNPAISILPNSLASYPWLAYVFLEIEHQEREVRSGLWTEVLIQLSKQKGKINVDNAIKKSASVVKVTPFSSSWLSIYRWAQESLDTPLDHPLLPLLWQKFFTLFLSRIPYTSAADKVCVGEKFFDGIINFTFLKRVKRRLLEVVDFYRNKYENEDTETSRKEFYKSCFGLFQAYLLWLEEPRLQDGNLLLQNLPPQYKPDLLSRIVEENSNTPWYEFLDNDQIRKDQQNCIKMWRVANFREKNNVNQPLSNAGVGMESTDPEERILRRLSSYESPKCPPNFKNKAPILPQVNFSCKETLFKVLEPNFKILRQFAHNHTMKVSEHKALDCAYQELIPQLYRSVLNKVKKKIPCKGKNQTVHCSGAAVIILEMQEARINERIQNEIEINRNAYESLLEKSLQFLPINLYVSSVTLQHCVRILQQQLEHNPSTAELGVELFYYILSLLNEETLAYLPTKILFTSCLEKLGQSHICGVEYELPRLLQWILKEPNLGSFLAPHFSPVNIGTSNILLMYSTICTEIAQKYDISFALLSKFDIEKWLNTKIPKLSQRSQFIECIIKALSTLGYDPPVEALMLHGLFRKHLTTVFNFQFPEHYGEVLTRLLKASSGNSESNLICTTVWIDILNSLAQPEKILVKAPLRDQLRQYAQYQKMLGHQELLETADLLARYFTQERFQYGLYGLYPKCRQYMDVYVLLFGMVGHGLVVDALNSHQGLLGDKICEKIWPYLREMFAPWLIPYSMQNCKDNMASWIKQLADDRSVLLPWIPSDSSFAQKMLYVFYECILFIINTLPSATNILSYLWQWYVASYAHVSVKDHILTLVHEVFVKFPWENFWPSLVDVEYMLKVLDQYLPECHSFLGYILVSVPWVKWINNFNDAPMQIRIRIYYSFLSLLVKLSVEPNVRKNYSERTKVLFVQAEAFDWKVLEPAAFQQIMDWWVMSCDSGVIFKSDPLDLECRLLHLLETVSGFDKGWPTLTINLEHKRLIYVRANIKFLSIYVSRNRNLLYSKQRDIQNVILGFLNKTEQVVSTKEEMHTLLVELCGIVNISDISLLATNVLIQWIQNKPGDSLIVKNLLKCIGVCMHDHEVLADLLELVINSYFCNTVSSENYEESTWTEVVELVNVITSKPLELEQVLINKGAVLSLNVILLQRVRRNMDKKAVLISCLNWIEQIKINESVETKVPLLWFSILSLALDLCDVDETTSSTLLLRFVDILLQTSENKAGTTWGRGLLSAIGLSKQEASTLNFRFVCKALAGYILAQLPDMKGKPQTVRRIENAPGTVGQPGGNTDCPKILLTLDFGQTQGKLKDAAQLALNMIQEPTNSLHNINSYLWLLLKQFYVKGYLKDVNL